MYHFQPSHSGNNAISEVFTYLKQAKIEVFMS